MTMAGTIGYMPVAPGAGAEMCPSEFVCLPMSGLRSGLAGQRGLVLPADARLDRGRSIVGSGISTVGRTMVGSGISTVGGGGSVGIAVGCGGSVGVGAGGFVAVGAGGSVGVGA